MCNGLSALGEAYASDATNAHVEYVVFCRRRLGHSEHRVPAAHSAIPLLGREVLSVIRHTLARRKRKDAEHNGMIYAEQDERGCRVFVHEVLATARLSWLGISSGDTNWEYHISAHYKGAECEHGSDHRTFFVQKKDEVNGGQKEGGEDSNDVECRKRTVQYRTDTHRYSYC